MGACAASTCEVRASFAASVGSYNLKNFYVSPLVLGVLKCFILGATSIVLYKPVQATRPDHNEGAFVVLMIINNSKYKC